MPTIRRVAALGCYIVASTLLVVCNMDGGYVKAALRMDAVPRGWPIILITDG